MRALFRKIRRASRLFWRGLREWCGDSAYERYLRASAARCAGCEPLTRERFYVEQLNRRYSKPSRCC